MLYIENIEKLNDTMLGYWKVVGVEDNGPTKWLQSQHYCITLGRAGEGAAILIERKINPLTKQYHVYVCYEEFDNRIHESSFSKRAFMDKGHFLKNMMGYVKAEYEMRKQK
jgi:hypothetical protein